MTTKGVSISRGEKRSKHRVPGMLQEVGVRRREGTGPGGQEGVAHSLPLRGGTAAGWAYACCQGDREQRREPFHMGRLVSLL